MQISSRIPRELLLRAAQTGVSAQPHVQSAAMTAAEDWLLRNAGSDFETPAARTAAVVEARAELAALVTNTIAETAANSFRMTANAPSAWKANRPAADVDAQRQLLNTAIPTLSNAGDLPEFMLSLLQSLHDGGARPTITIVDLGDGSREATVGFSQFNQFNVMFDVALTGGFGVISSNPNVIALLEGTAAVRGLMMREQFGYAVFSL